MWLRQFWCGRELQYSSGRTPHRRQAKTNGIMCLKSVGHEGAMRVVYVYWLWAMFSGRSTDSTVREVRMCAMSVRIHYTALIGIQFI